MKAQSVGGGWSGVATGYPLVFLKSSFTNHEKNDSNSYDPKNLALHVQVLFKDIPINV